jgi:hypothetical protein
MNVTPVTDEDRKSFRRWLRETESRYAAIRGMRERPEYLQSDKARRTGGSVAVGRELRESVARALAALVLHEKAEDDPMAFLRPWVGPFQDVARAAVALLESERDSLQHLGVFGLWCEDDDYRRFIRPVAMTLTSTPAPNFAMSAVCGRRKCRRVTVMWADEAGVWVGCAPQLKGHNHPMRPHDIYAWVKRQQPPRTHRAQIIAPNGE